MVVVKVSLGEDIRRFTLASVPSFSVLRGMLEKLFDQAIQSNFDVKYLDPEGDQITVTTDSELNDAFGLAPLAGDQKLLRLYLVPKGTNPSLLASTYKPSTSSTAAASSNNNSTVMDVDLTPLLSQLTGNSGGNPLASLINLLSSSSRSAQPSNEQGTSTSSNGADACPYFGPLRYICDGCSVSPISGNVNQCDTCPDFHLCDSCRNAGVHMEKEHTFSVNPRGRCGRFNRRPHHFPWNPQGNQQPSTATGAGQTEPAVAPASPAASPLVPEIKKPITVLPAPTFAVQPLKPQIIETTGSKPASPIVPPALLVPSEKLEMAFLSDVTIPDGSEIAVGETFSKVWRLSNSGTTTWPLGCRLALESNTGDRLSTVEYVDIPGEVPPQSAVTISVEMEAPKKAGRHVSYWRMHGPSGAPFGSRIWVDVISTEKRVVSEPIAIAPVVAEPAVPEAANAGIKPGEKYAVQLESLYRMGFLNVDLNRNLLDHNKGNVAAVIDQLFAHQ